MEENEVTKTPEKDRSWQFTPIIIGGVLGALFGMGAAFLLTKKAEQKGHSLALTPTKGVQLGVIIAGMLRSILSLGED
jgi:hypothetical protein